MKVTKIDRVLFMGSKQLGLKCLATMYELDPNSLIGIMTIDDREDTRSVYEEFDKFSRRAGLKLITAGSRKQSEETVKSLKPGLVFVVNWYWLISRDCLSSVPNGFFGVHGALLPQCRGASPLVWAIINGDSEAGVSLFSLTEGMDEGDIVAQRRFRIEPADYISDILKKLEDEAVSMFKEKYGDILNRSLALTSQDHAKATYCAQRLPCDGLVDWSKSAKQVYDFIRAQSEPYPGAFTFLNGQKLTIWRAHPLNILYCGTLGQVVLMRDQGVLVVCGDHRPIVLDTVQLGERPKERAAEVLRSNRIRLV